MWKKLVAALVILIILAWIGWQYVKPVPAARVRVVEPVVQSLSTKLDLNAVVVNNQTVTITALLNGEIGQIKVREGQLVKRAQPLALLNNQQAYSLLDKAKAEVDYSQQKVNSTSRTYNRLKNLSRAGNASKQSLEDSLDALRSATAEQTVATANVTLAELHLKDATVSAPFAGVVTQQFAETGQWVEAGTPLFEIAATDGYLIQALVDASDWAQVSLNQSVALTTESSPDAAWTSNVSWIAPTVTRNDRNAKAVAIRFPYGDNAPPLLLGQEIDAQLVLKQTDDVLSLPLSAMIEQSPNEYSVFLAVDNKAQLKPVSVGLINATHAEIVEGLGENDTVIVGNGFALEENMPIEIQ